MVENVEADAAVFERIRFWKDFRPHAAHIFATDHALREHLPAQRPRRGAADDQQHQRRPDEDDVDREGYPRVVIGELATQARRQRRATDRAHITLF